MTTDSSKEKPQNVLPLKIYIFIAVGFILLVLPLISLLVDTQLIFIKQSTQIKKDSEVLNLLQGDIPGALIHVYVFNVTNGDAFTSGQDLKLKVQEVGPFVYQEFRRNQQFELDEEAGVMRYTPRLWTKFLPEQSVGDPREVNVTVPNTALLAMASMISKQPYLPTKAGFNLLVSQVASTALMEMDVHSHLWGYDEPLIRVGNMLLPGWITFSKMGILDRLYDQSAIPRLELSTKDEDKFRIRTLNGAKGLNVWEYENPSKRTRCNTLEDTYEGIAYPAGLTPETKLRLYRNVFCRMLDLDLVGTRSFDYGSEAFVYQFTNDTFRMGPKTECLCGKYGCWNGVTDLSPCLYNLPLYLSQAHFLDADPELYERIDGMRPNQTTHGSEVVVDPKIGLVLSTRFTLQLSVDVQDVSFNSRASPFSNMFVPIAYFKIEQLDIPEEAKNTLRKFYFTVTYYIRGFEICSLILAVVILVFAARKIYWSVLCSNGISYISKEKQFLHVIQIEPLMDEKRLGHIRVLEAED